MDYFGEDVDLKVLLEMLKSDDDPIVVHQHCETLRNQLSRSEEKALQDFPLNGYISRLIELLGHTIMMDFQVDTKYSIMQTFWFLMDIFPSTIGQMVAEGLITTITQVIQENMQYTDLADQAAKLFVRISAETPEETLKSPALLTLMQVYDFCDSHCQQKIMKLTANVSRHASTEETFTEKVLPVLEWVYHKVVISRFGSDTKGAEQIASILLSMISSMNNFYSPSRDFPKFVEKIEAIMNTGLTETILNCLKDYVATQMSQQATQNDSEDVAMQIGMIDTGGQQGAQDTTYNEQTVSILLQILTFGCKFSHVMVAQILHDGVLQAITNLLPEGDAQDLPTFVNDLLGLLSLVLPDTADDLQNQKKTIVFGPRQVYPPSKEPDSHYQLLKGALTSLQAQKKELATGMDVSFFEFLATTLLPKLFFLYKTNVGQIFRERCISIIDKVLAVLPDAVATEKIDPVSLAQLVNQILATGSGSQVLISLQITSRALQSNAVKFVIPFRREGTCEVIAKLASDPDVLAKYDKESSKEPSPAELFGQYAPDHHHHHHKKIMGLFGRSSSDHEAVDILQLEIEKIKGILQMAEGSIPNSKRDMLSLALKDKEMSLKLLKESQEMKKEAERLTKIAEDEAIAAEVMLVKATLAAEEAKAALEAKAGGEEAKAEVSGPKTESEAAEEYATCKKEEPVKMSIQIQQECQQIVKNFVKNEDFERQLSDTNGDELHLLNRFKELARDILDEACSSIFDCQRTQALMDRLTSALTSSHSITTFEFVQSGILRALEIFLTKAPSQALIERETILNKDKTEELKHSEELILAAAQKQAKQQISQKEARCLLFRIKVAANVLCIDKVGKLPLRELIHQCHSVISNNESILFEETKGGFNPDATEAIRQLHRREMVKIVYDPTGILMEQAQRKELGLPVDDDFKMEEESILEMSEPVLGGKAKSTMPYTKAKTLVQLGSLKPAALIDGTINDAEMIEEKSQVFQKRDRLFSVLNQVQLDVQHAENLWMVEERLKKVDTCQKAKDYGQLHEKHPLRGMLKTSEEAEELADRFNTIADEDMQELMDQLGGRIDQMLDEASSQAHFELLKPEFIKTYSEQICDMAYSQDMEDINLKLFFEMTQLEMEERIQEHEMAVLEDENAPNDLLRPEHVKTLMIAKISAFGKMIKQTQEKTFELYDQKKSSQPKRKSSFEAPDETMQDEEEEKKAAQENEESKAASFTEDKATIPTHNRAEFAEPPKITLQVSSDGANTELVQQPEDSDNEMTDEQKSPIHKPSVTPSLNQLKPDPEEGEDPLAPKKKQWSRKNSRARADSIKIEDKNALDGLDLQDLIRKNNGTDIDLEFYFKGKLLPQNTCFFEIHQQSQKGKKQVVKPQDMPKFDKNNPSSLFKHLMATMSRGEDPHDGGHKMTTIYFRLVDRSTQASQATRKDSLADFAAARRERTRSQAADLVSVQALNSVVQRLIETEFSVFQRTVDDEILQIGDAEKQQLEQALKILKVLNFISKNTYLLSEAGLNFLLSRSESGQELKELASKDMDLSLPLTGCEQVFHHGKLDANILKQIQDPHRLVSGGLTGMLKEIFTSCSFLFGYETKVLYFKLVSFLGVDINRSLGYLRQYQKKRAPSQQIFIPEEESKRQRGQATNMNDMKQQETVSRENIIVDSLPIMERLEKRKTLDMRFKGEEGTGLGPTYEYFTLLARNIKDAKNGTLWRIGSSDGSLFPSPLDQKSMTEEQVTEVMQLFRLAGTFLAKSIVDDKLIDLPISSLMWDLLLGKNLNLFDLRQFSPEQFRFLCELQTVANRKREIDDMQCDAETKQRLKEGIRTASGTTLEDLCQYFILPAHEPQIELILDGANTAVTNENVQDFIDLVLHSTFYDCINLQLQSFKKGFNSVLPLDSIRTFNTKVEIETMTCGHCMEDAEWQDLAKLKRAIKADHGFTAESQSYNDFLRFICEMEPNFRPKFIQWLTGCKRLPKGGFSSLEHQVSVNRVADKSLRGVSPDEQCPSVNTCLHYVKFPGYSSYEILKHKFETAILYGADVFTLN